MSNLDYDFNLGVYQRELDNISSEAQEWFDIGLNWLFGFNHDEAVVCFQKAIEADPDGRTP